MTTHDAGTRLDQLYRRLTVPLAGRVAGWPGVTPNRVSGVAFATGGLLAPLLAARRRPRLAGLAFLAGDVLDYLDGDVARAQRSTSAAGDVLDGVLDRYTDALCVGAMGLVAAGVFGPPRPALLLGTPSPRTANLVTLAAVTGCLLPSYVKALSVANDRNTPQSIGGRGTRNRIVWAGLLCDQPFWTTAVLAVLSHVAAVHRAVYTISRRGERTGPSPA